MINTCEHYAEKYVNRRSKKAFFSKNLNKWHYYYSESHSRYISKYQIIQRISFDQDIVLKEGEEVSITFTLRYL